MRRGLSYLVIGIISVMFFGCTSNQQMSNLSPDEKAYRMKRTEFVEANGGGGPLPKWFKRPADFAGKGMVAVKASEAYTDEIDDNYSEMYTSAMEKAREEIAAILDTNVKIVRYKKKNKITILKKKSYEKAVDESIKETTDVPVSAVIAKDEYINKLGTLSIFAVLDPSFISKFLKNRKVDREEFLQANKDYMDHKNEMIEDAKKELNN